MVGSARSRTTPSDAMIPRKPKSRSFQVARLAGVPKEILERAKDILSHLEKPNGTADTQKSGKNRRSKKVVSVPEKPQLDLF